MADGVAQFGSSFSATVDPTFTIDPSFSERYNLVFSEGIQNGIGAVPEPSTWTLLILGFAGVGFMAYRRRKTAALVACAMLVANLPSVSHAEVILPGQVVTATFDVPNDFSFAFMSIQTGYNSNLNPPTTYALNVYDALQNNVFSATGNPGFTTSQGFMAPNTIDSSHFTIVIDQVVGAFNLDVINVLFSNSGNFNPVGAFGQNVAPNLGVGSPFAISAAVPEPSTWAMLLIGCAGVGFMAYRRRSQSVALSAT
jgi:PEP-CTERM motif